MVSSRRRTTSPQANVDPYPATVGFTAYCAALGARVAWLVEALASVRRAVKTVSARLAKAVAAGDRAGAGRLRARLVQLEEKLAKTVKSLASARKQAAPCRRRQP